MKKLLGRILIFLLLMGMLILGSFAPAMGQTTKVIEARSYIKIIDTEGDKLNIGANSGADINAQDNTAPSLFVKFSKITNNTTLTVATTTDIRYIVVDDTTGVSNSGLITVFSGETDRVYFGSIVSKNIDTVFVDSPLDSDFPIGADVTFALTNMAVDGSTTPQIFGMRNPQVGDTIGLSFDITRIMFKCFTTGTASLDKFGDQDKLTYGLMMRRVDGVTRNIWNVKDNGELAGIMFDWESYVSTNPVQGQDGFTGRLTFAGMNKVGTALRIGPGEDIQFWVMDDNGAILLLEITAEGHIVTDN